MAAAQSEPIEWPEELEDNDRRESALIQSTQGRIVHIRHRVGDYDVTRIILDPVLMHRAGRG